MDGMQMRSTKFRFCKAIYLLRTPQFFSYDPLTDLIHVLCANCMSGTITWFLHLMDWIKTWVICSSCSNISLYCTIIQCPRKLKWHALKWLHFVFTLRYVVIIWKALSNWLALWISSLASWWLLLLTWIHLLNSIVVAVYVIKSFQINLELLIRV